MDIFGLSCSALVKSLAGGEGQKTSACVGSRDAGGRDKGTFFYDALDFRNVFLVYTSKPIDPVKSPLLVLPCFL